MAKLKKLPNEALLLKEAIRISMIYAEKRGLFVESRSQAAEVFSVKVAAVDFIAHTSVLIPGGS
ncbi:MAG: hypothetical protein CMD83_05200 [Gammaproteobacteria bacterium]|nr:hypothetical protein [Gammaproteobacteria bacterium]|tara:strand:- start:409 stop:600 length:192 start_codon:yes stop_codon:yes gene_type:complete